MKNKEPKHEYLLALSKLDAGAWEIDSDWKKLGFLSSDLSKRAGWIHVNKEPSLNGTGVDTLVMWTSHRDTHHRLRGPAHGLTIDEEGKLLLYAKSDTNMRVVWSRNKEECQVGDEQYFIATDVAEALHHAMIVDKRARLHSQTTINIHNTNQSSEQNKPRKPKMR